MGFHLRRKRGSVVLAMDASIGRPPTEIRRVFIDSFCSSGVKPEGAGMEDGAESPEGKHRETINVLQSLPDTSSPDLVLTPAALTWS
ncbi:hypothetical protein EYF80_017148 [Liparis tanakae]|uniref:Uncharacterized protein n=1 Tax=Liparis tanakae TaxID=230148 RepID=A0A4Z2I3P8_9TELE|nr:hypothetical protein EYF80_017148 [Liparis tanakae]